MPRQLWSQASGRVPNDLREATDRGGLGPVFFHPGRGKVDETSLRHEAATGAADLANSYRPAGFKVRAQALEVAVIHLNIGVGRPPPFQASLSGSPMTSSLTSGFARRETWT